MFSCKQIANSNEGNSLSERDSISILKTGVLKPMPEKWIDVDTHHKVKKLAQSLPKSRSFYFHNRPFLSSKDTKDDLMVFYGLKDSINQLFTVNLQSGELQQITDGPEGKKGEIVAPNTRRVYYMVHNKVYYTHIDTRQTKLVYEFPDSVIGGVTTINSDENILGGVLITKKEQEIFNKNPKKSNYFNSIYEAKLKRTLITINIESGVMNEIYSENAWLNHVQFSPANPRLLMYCHEGPWHKVDRIWTIDVTTKEKKLMHKRTMEMEIAGHEFFSPDGKTIWYDLQIPRGETFYLAGINTDLTGFRKYGLKRNDWSIHYNISPDMKSFAGDGGDEGQVAKAKDGRWIYHFTVKGDSLIAEKLVNMKNHNYDLEPNVHFSPDGKWIIFRANFEGNSHIYAVEIAKNNISLHQ
ncbi:oligogalacturonate lyase family protein [Abyssalbus ytuae]|uniref:Oligogalacturonate lyase family protein n=1 Tax=Abyssalbus ytuae TaxID=2926907 RepID=A0A9E6ZNU3_9FLAO|nr:oligogalacturonate lyase family protein [Abyssalbus ytuae]UOB17775.1 oligogalacturonate lyase family protein [Abyssalbus ytuae]